jgi:hypothetical protein
LLANLQHLIPRFTINLDSLIWWIKHFRLVFGIITDSDNQGKVTGNIVDRDNEASFILIMTDNHEGRHFSPNLSNSADDSPDQTVDRIKI